MKIIWLQIRLTVTAGYIGIFPEPELLVWLRAILDGSGKVLIVQPVESIDAVDERPRTYRAHELSVAPDRVSSLVGMFDTLGFPGRVLEIEDTVDPESIWWASTTLEVTANDAKGRLEFGVGPGGVRGPDAAAVKEIFRALCACAEVQSRWSDLLSGRADAGT